MGWGGVGRGGGRQKNLHKALTVIFAKQRMQLAQSQSYTWGGETSAYAPKRPKESYPGYGLNNCKVQGSI